MTVKKLLYFTSIIAGLCIFFAPLHAQTIIKSDTSDYDILFRDNDGSLSSFHNSDESVNVSITDFSGGFIVEYYRAILQFNISELTSTVDKAKIHVYSEASGGSDFDVDVYGSTDNRNDFIHAADPGSEDEFFADAQYTLIGSSGNFITPSDPDFEWYTIDLTSFLNDRINDYLSNSADSVVILKLRPDGAYSSGGTNYNFSSGNDTNGKEPFLSVYDGSTDQVITGTEGWRILSTPTSDNTYDDLLGDLWTQGIPAGADVTNGDPSVLMYDGSSFTAVNDLMATMSPGVGFATYVYSDDNYDGISEGFPKTISVTGTENTGSISPSLTAGADEWTLVGNPYAFPIAWEELSKTDLTGTVYVYDHDIPSYISWNGSSGALTDGRIATMQGFWVQNSASATSEVLTIEETDKANAGTFYKEKAEPEIKLVASKGELSNSAFLSFTENGKVEKDNFDGLKLSPLDFQDHLSVSSLTGNTKLDINNLPVELEGELEIPILVENFTADDESKEWIPRGGEITLSWPKVENIPEHWSLTLTDYQTGTTTDMKNLETYSFTLKESDAQAKEASISSILRPIVPTVEQMRKSADAPRFGITISAGNTVSNESGGTPKGFALKQNYPNPFNPTTSIQYSVENAGEVSLTVYNVMGQQVATLVSESKSAGTYQVSWDASNNASGIYYYRLESAGQVLTRQMTLIK
jgi:hypothetical protein